MNQAIEAPTTSLVPLERRLLNMRQLAVELGVGYSFVRSMVHAGFPLMGARRSTVPRAIKWLEEHPEFRVYKWTLVVPAVRSAAVDPAGQPPGSVDKCG